MASSRTHHAKYNALIYDPNTAEHRSTRIVRHQRSNFHSEKGSPIAIKSALLSYLNGHIAPSPMTLNCKNCFKQPKNYNSTSLYADSCNTSHASRCTPIPRESCVSISKSHNWHGVRIVAISFNIQQDLCGISPKSCQSTLFRKEYLWISSAF